MLFACKTLDTFPALSAYSASALAATAGVICLTWLIKAVVSSRYRRRRLDEKLSDQSYVYDAKVESIAGFIT